MIDRIPSLRSGVLNSGLYRPQTWVCGTVAGAESLQRIASQGARRHTVPTDLPAYIALSDRGLQPLLAVDTICGESRKHVSLLKKAYC